MDIATLRIVNPETVIEVDTVSRTTANGSICLWPRHLRSMPTMAQAQSLHNLLRAEEALNRVVRDGAITGDHLFRREDFGPFWPQVASILKAYEN